jgi:S1-C subfamily serine protease
MPVVPEEPQAVEAVAVEARPAGEKLVALRTFVIGAVLMWLIAVAGWAATKGFESWSIGRVASDVETSKLRLASVAELQGVFNEVNAAVEPSVVKIDVLRPPNSSQNGPETNSGSGVIVEVDTTGRSPVGYVVTNEHVIRGTSRVSVTLFDGRTVEATVIGDDSSTDLAVLRVPAVGLIAADWGDSDALRQGDWVLAFGSPFGFAGSMTAGIVSALNRTQSDVVLNPAGEFGYQDFIQVDAAINPGNSGGPLVDITGSIVGINTAIFTRTGDFSGIGFAIPSNQARRIFTDIRDTGRVVRGWVGVSGVSVRDLPGAADRLGLEDDRGVVINRVFRGTPAAEAGLLRGDVVVAIDDARIDDYPDLRNTASFATPGDVLTLAIIRDGESLDLPLTVGEAPAGQLTLPLEPLGVDLFGLELIDSNAGPPVVVSVERGSPASRAGIEPGDFVYSVNERPVMEAAAAERLLSMVPPTVGATVRIGDGSRVVQVLLRDD